MTEDEKCKAIAKYTALADDHLKRVCENSYGSESEYRAAYNAVLEEKTIIKSYGMRNLTRKHGETFLSPLIVSQNADSTLIPIYALWQI